jgi:hypothetical protein
MASRVIWRGREREERWVGRGRAGQGTDVLGRQPKHDFLYCDLVEEAGPGPRRRLHMVSEVTAAAESLMAQ